MKKLFFILLISVLSVVVLFVLFSQRIEEKEFSKSEIVMNKNLSTNSDFMKLSSPVFVHQGLIPSRYTCDGENTSPPLEIIGVPAEAKSLVLIMDDPDAVKPAGKVWDHWIVFNIPPSTSIIKEGEEPPGVPGLGTGGNKGYSGPCPPDGEHRYFFKVYALDIELDLPAGAVKQDILAAMDGHILAEAELVGLYNRK